MRYFVCPFCGNIEKCARTTTAVIHEHNQQETFLYRAIDRKDARNARFEFSKRNYDRLTRQMEARARHEEFKDKPVSKVEARERAQELGLDTGHVAGLREDPSICTFVEKGATNGRST